MYGGIGCEEGVKWMGLYGVGLESFCVLCVLEFKNGVVCILCWFCKWFLLYYCVCVVLIVVGFVWCWCGMMDLV